MRIDQNMTIYNAAALKPVVLAAVLDSDNPEIDLSSVNEIDSSGLQLLLLARREATARGRTLRLVGAGAAVSEVLDFVSFMVDARQSSGARPTVQAQGVGA